MNFDFSQEEKQQQFHNGPVPAGSMVIVRIKLLEPMDEARAPENSIVKMTQYGLRQLYVQLEVMEGTYKGVSWRQSLTLPYGMQQVRLTDGQATACKIGGAMLKAMLQAAKRPLNVSDLRMFDGLKFPVKVKIDSREKTSRGGTVYWVNEIAQVITPDMEDYEQIRVRIEIINPDGAVTGSKGASRSCNSFSSHDNACDPFTDDRQIYRAVDEVPF